MNKNGNIFLTVLLIFLICGVIKAEAGNDINSIIPASSSEYEVCSYPSDDSVFSIPFGFNVRFQITNGKYFYLKLEDMIGDYECNYDVYFYDDNGDKIAKQNVRQPVNSYNIPQNERSINLDRLYVRIVNNGKEAHRNFKFIVASPKKAISGEKNDKNADFNVFFKKPDPENNPQNNNRHRDV